MMSFVYQARRSMLRARAAEVSNTCTDHRPHGFMVRVECKRRTVDLMQWSDGKKILAGAHAWIKVRVHKCEGQLKGRRTSPS